MEIGDWRDQILTHVLHLLLGHDAGEGQRRRAAGHCLGDGEVALPVAKTLVVESLQAPVRWGKDMGCAKDFRRDVLDKKIRVRACSV